MFFSFKTSMMFFFLCIFSYESTKNILFPSNQCTVCHQPLSLFCSQCNRPVTSHPSTIVTKPPVPTKKVKKNTQVLREPSQRVCKKRQQILDISSKKKSKKRRSEEKKADTAVAELNLAGNVDEDATVDDHDGGEDFSDKLEEDLDFHEDDSAGSQPKEVR